VSFYKYCALFFAYSISFGKEKVVETMRHKQRWMAVGGATVQFRSSGQKRRQNQKQFRFEAFLQQRHPSISTGLPPFRSLSPFVFFSFSQCFSPSLRISCVSFVRRVFSASIPLFFPLASVSFCCLAIMLIIACLLDRYEWMHL